MNSDASIFLLSRWTVLPLLAAAAFLAFNLYQLYSITDDAYISYRYLDNWLAGEGLSYNTGERVEGYTNFLWIVLLAPLRLIGLSPELASTLLSLSALTLLLWSLFHTATNLTGDRLAGWLALLLGAGSIHLAYWSVSGMETTLFAALLAWGNYRLSLGQRHTPGSSLAFGLAALTRPTGVAHTGIAFLAALPPALRKGLSGIRPLIGPGLLFAAIVAAHLLFRFSYYGEIVPNTYHAKLGGNMPDLTGSGLHYLTGFLTSGGAVLLLPALLVVLFKRSRNWLCMALLAQLLFQLAYAVRVGGDYFPFHRFLVPIIPQLSVLAALTLCFGLPWRRKPLLLLLAGALLVTAQALMASGSTYMASLKIINETRAERELVAAWLQRSFPQGTTLAINTAGVVPYRVGWPTIDMLGLNDQHIAKSDPIYDGTATVFVGHYKHDGSYVCGRQPGVVLTSSGSLHSGRSPQEAIMQSALNTFPGDREFIRECGAFYETRAEQLGPNRYVVAYVRRQGGGSSADQGSVDTADGLFRQGLQAMQRADFERAVESFQASLALAPGNVAAIGNLGFALLDLRRHAEAREQFEKVLRLQPDYYDALYGLALAQKKLGERSKAAELWRRYLREAPDSPWKERARKKLRLLSK